MKIYNARILLFTISIFLTGIDNSIAAPTLPLISSHRGIMNQAQENTEESIIASIQMKIPIMNIDIMVTNHGDIVCNHDDNIKDFISSHKDTWIKQLTRQQIKDLDIADVLTYERNGKILTHQYSRKGKWVFLDEVFDKYIDQTMFWFDIKSRSWRLSDIKRDAKTISDFLAHRMNKLDRVIITSTNPVFLMYFATQAKQKGYFKSLTIGVDYGFENQVWNRLALKSGIFEKLYHFNFITAGRNFLTQEMIDSRPKVKFLSYAYQPHETPEFRNLYSYLVEYFP